MDSRLSWDIPPSTHDVCEEFKITVDSQEDKHQKRVLSVESDEVVEAVVLISKDS